MAREELGKMFFAEWSQKLPQDNCLVKIVRLGCVTDGGEEPPVQNSTAAQSFPNLFPASLRLQHCSSIEISPTMLGSSIQIG